MKELKKVLLAYKEKVSGVKADLILRANAVFSRLEQQESSAASRSELVLVEGDAEFRYNAIFSTKCSHLLWFPDLRGTPGFSFIQLSSMKNTLYKVLVILSNTSGDVCCADCTCLAGAGLGGFGNCDHVGGVLFALEDLNRKAYQDCPEPVSCTSRLSAWNVPTSFV
eukprot:gene11846-2386_t